MAWNEETYRRHLRHLWKNKWWDISTKVKSWVGTHMVKSALTSCFLNVVGRGSVYVKGAMDHVMVMRRCWRARYRSSVVQRLLRCLCSDGWVCTVKSSDQEGVNEQVPCTKTETLEKGHEVW